MSVDIGGRLRFVRIGQKLSQRELAKRSGVTNSTISLIESNQMNPSVGALKRILDGIPMGLAEFFAIEPEKPRKAFYRAEELTEIGKKPISYRQVGDNLFGRSLQILKDRYGAILLGGDAAQPLDDCSVLLMGAMGEVQAGNIHAQPHQIPQRVLPIRCRAHRADDFGSPGMSPPATALESVAGFAV